MSHVIYIFLEGGDDARFFDKVIKKELLKKHSKVQTIKYAQITRPALEKFVEMLDKSNTAYIFFSDMDSATCYTKKKNFIRSKAVKSVNAARIIIVKTEIESWYLAGLSRNGADSLNIQHFPNTEKITKKNLIKYPKDTPQELIVW